MEKEIENIKHFEWVALTLEQDDYHERGELHFLDKLGLNPERYIQIEDEILEKEVKAGNFEKMMEELLALEGREPEDIEKYFIERVIAELRKRK